MARPTRLQPDAENRDTQKALRTDGEGEKALFFPGDVACAIRGANSEGTEGFIEAKARGKIAGIQRQALVTSGLLPELEFPKKSVIDAQGAEHVVRFFGARVEKHQRAEAWVPVITGKGKLGIDQAIPTEYLRRLELQNEIFGDDIRIVALTRAIALSSPNQLCAAANQARMKSATCWNQEVGNAFRSTSKIYRSSSWDQPGGMMKKN